MLTRWCLDANRIAVNVFVEASGQTVRISLDNQDHDVTPVDSQQPAWTSDSLDPSAPHDLQIIKQNPAGQFLELDSILVTYSDQLTTTTEQTTATGNQTQIGLNQSIRSTGLSATLPATTPASIRTTSMSGAPLFGPFSSGSSTK